MSDTDAPRHPIAVVARRTGLKADLIRAWERRYGAVRPGRDARRQRVYSDRDVARLCLLREAVAHGRAIGSVASLDDDELAGLLRDDHRVEPSDAAAGLTPPEASQRAVQSLAAAAAEGDTAAMTAILERAAVDHGVGGAVSRVAVPLLESLARDHARDRVRSAHLRLATASVHGWLAAVAARSHRRDRAAPAAMVLGLGRDDGLVAAAAAVAAATGWRAVPFGVGPSPEEAAAGCELVGARAVVVDPGAEDDPAGAEAWIVDLRRLQPSVALVWLERGVGRLSRLRWGSRGVCRTSLDGLAEALDPSPDDEPAADDEPGPDRIALLVGERAARRYALDGLPAAPGGRGVLADLPAVRRLADRLNDDPDRRRRELAPTSAGQVAAAAATVDLARHLMQRRSDCSDAVLGELERGVGPLAVAGILEEVARRYGRDTTDGGRPGSDRVAAELVALWLAGRSRPLAGLRDLVDGDDLDALLSAVGVADSLPRTIAAAAPDLDDLACLLARHSDDLRSQIEALLGFARSRGVTRVGPLLLALDLLQEEGRLPFAAPSGPAPGPAADRIELPSAPPRATSEPGWARDLVLAARHTLVWLAQLSVRHSRPITRLDQVPEAALAGLAADGVSGLWLVGVWDRSRASESIKRMMGNPEAAASAYAIRQYRVAPELGGDGAVEALATRAAAHGIRLGCDMVANHTGLDSVWMLEHPDRFLSRPDPPYPAYSFDGPDLSPDPRIAIQLADQYYDRSDAAVVFRRTDRTTGEVRYVYHGNDGTGLPWNDTAQLDVLSADTRRAVVDTIVEVARRFPIVRFDAAMTLARQHVRRLWYPAPGDGGAIPSRSGHGVGADEFDRRMPREFWLEAVEAVERHAPDTLLVAEAFWLLERYFAGSLGMHRVYNSSFMHQARDGDAAGLRDSLRDSLRIDPALLGRMVNFLTTPDEAPAAEQLGRGDRYFAAATVLATLPGTPLLGHGQVEGLGERYGMEYRRPYVAESPDPELVGRHRREIAPLLAMRSRFSDPAGFRLLELAPDGTGVVTFVARSDQGAALVAVNLDGAPARCRAVRATAGGGVSETVADALGLPADEGGYGVLTDPIRGARAVVFGRETAERGLTLDLGPHETRVLLGPELGRESAGGPVHRLAERLDGRLLPASEPWPDG